MVHDLSVEIDRIHIGCGKPGKSWNLRIEFSRPGKCPGIKLSVLKSHGKFKLCLID